MKKNIIITSILIILMSLFYNSLEGCINISEDSNKFITYANNTISPQELFNVRDYERVLSKSDERAAGAAAVLLLLAALAVVYIPNKGQKKSIINHIRTSTREKEKKN